MPKSLILTLTCLFAVLVFCEIAPAQVPSKLAPKGFDARRDGIPHGKIETVEYPSATVGTRRKMVIYTPPAYVKSSKYPVLYLLHGAKFDETGWKTQGAADAILDNLYADKKLAPMIVVMPNGYASKSGKKDTSAFEDDLLKDIIPHVEANYAAQADRDHRAIAGQSMGGGQALRIGLKNLDRFAWVAGFSPALGNSADVLTDPVAASKKLKLLWVSCGDKDSLLKSIETFHLSLDAKKVPHLWHIGSGDHSWPVWKNDLYLFAQLLFRDEQKAAAKKTE